MHDTNLAYWGLWVVPLGLVICFGYPLLIWLRVRGRDLLEFIPVESVAIGNDSV